MAWMEACALVTAAAFMGAAIYVNVAEHPARTYLEPAAALTQWKPAYKYGARMQAPLALIGFVLGAWAGYSSGELLWYVGAALLLAAWPYTLLVILPVNNKLLALDPSRADADTLAMLQHWNRLHMGRSALGIASTLCMIGAAA
jgi:hypothetical protein